MPNKKPRPLRENAKVAIIGMNGDVPSVLLLTRSNAQQARKKGGDLPGGRLEGRDPLTALLDEVNQELGSVALRHVTKIGVLETVGDDERVISHFYAAVADIPEGGIMLSHEHTQSDWHPLDQFSDANIPKKYRMAAISEAGRLAMHATVELARKEAAQQSALALVS